jgi:hypothetical protein
VVDSVDVIGGSRGLALATRKAESVFSSAWLIWCRLPEGGVGRSSSSVRSMVVRGGGGVVFPHGEGSRDMSLRRRRHWYVSSLVIPFSSVPLLAYFRASPAYGLFLRGSIVVLFLSSYGRG